MRAGTVTERSPLELLYDGAGGEPLPLPPELARLYGQLRLPEVRRRPYVISNFVQSLDGVAALGISGTSGGQISGSNPRDRFVMGLLRATADAVVVGAGTARSVPGHLWTSDYIFPGLADEYAELRRRLGRAELPVNVIVTARGDVDASQLNGVTVTLKTDYEDAACAPLVSALRAWGPKTGDGWENAATHQRAFTEVGRLHAELLHAHVVGVRRLQDHADLAGREVLPDLFLVVQESAAHRVVGPAHVVHYRR